MHKMTTIKNKKISAVKEQGTCYLHKISCYIYFTQRKFFKNYFSRIQIQVFINFFLKSINSIQIQYLISSNVSLFSYHNYIKKS